MKQRNEIIALIVLLAAAVGVWYWQWHTPSAGGKDRSFSFAQSYQPLNFPNPTIRFDKVDQRRKAEYLSRGVNLFSQIVPPSPEDLKKSQELQQQQAKEAADRNQQLLATQQTVVDIPANLKFFGYGNVPLDSARRAFLEDGDEVYIVNEGDTLLGRFRILKINNASIEFEEVGSGRRGRKMMEDQGPA